MRKSWMRILMLLSLPLLVLTACKEEEEEEPEIPPIDRGHTEADRIQIVFSSVVGSIKTVEDTAILFDPDGPGGAAARVIDSLELTWRSPSNDDITYESEITFYKSGNPINSIIQTNFDDYIVCYRKFEFDELNLKMRNTDPNGITLGLVAEWNTKFDLNTPTTGNGIINITLNYQSLRKIGLCDDGIRIFEGNLPYRLK